MTESLSRSCLTVLICFALVCGFLASPARAWHDEGHVFSAIAAVEALPEEVPAFFREGGATIAHLAIDPDVYRNRKLPQLVDATSSDHFIDLELLQGRALPAKRSEYIALCEELGVDPVKVGYLPYAVTEQTQRLTIALAEHRKWPDNEAIRLKCLVYAGLLAHHAADLHMPLHTSVHYNGKVPVTKQADGTMGYGDSPRTGIHTKIDALPTYMAYDDVFREGLPKPVTLEGDLFKAVVAEMNISHVKLEDAYALAGKLPEVGKGPIEDDAVKAFTRERMQASARFLASLYLRAWNDAADVEVADWLDRPAFDEGFDRSKPVPQGGE